MQLLHTDLFAALALASLFALCFLIFREDRHGPRIRRRSTSRPAIVPSHPAHAGRSAPKPPWVAKRLIRLKALMPDAGCRTLANIFNRRYAHRQVSVSNSHVAAVLLRERLAVLRLRQELKHRVPRATALNQTWGMDLTGRQDAQGVVHAILGIVDHGSRRLLRLCLCPRASALTLLGHLFLAMGRHGVPRILRTDNAAVFTGRWFGWGLALAGVRHQRSDPGCPWQNGRIERVFGTLKARLAGWRLASGAALDQWLMEFAVWYNAVRPHQHLGGATPLEAWHGIDPYVSRPRAAIPVSFWEGQLKGYVLRR